jgi:hypothetical protein
VTAKPSLILAALFLLSGIGTADAEIGTTAGPVAPAATHPNNRDDWNIARTFDTRFISHLTPSFVNAAQQWANNGGLCGSAKCNFVLPGALNLEPINASELNVLQYNPWVIDNNDLVNYITLPDKTHRSRLVTGQDAGGANFLLTYTPVVKSDPTKINFLQVVHTTYESIELPLSVPADFTRFDNGGGPSPFYNYGSTSGVDNKTLPTVPLTILPTDSFAWMADIPYRCENDDLLSFGCEVTTKANDGLITRVTQIFDTYLESDVIVHGQTYQVLYGGVRWGYTYHNWDVPEPSTWAMMLLGFAGLGGLLRWRRRTAPAPA